MESAAELLACPDPTDYCPSSSSFFDAFRDAASVPRDFFTIYGVDTVPWASRPCGLNSNKLASRPSGSGTKLPGDAPTLSPALITDPRALEREGAPREKRKKMSRCYLTEYIEVKDRM